LRVVRWAYQRRLLTRGYGRSFELVPSMVWGGHAVQVQTDIGPLVVPIRDRGSRSILIFGRLLHEKAETRFLQSLLKRAERVVDIGANIGWYSVLAAAAMEGRGRVFAFEPNATVLPYLRANADGKEVQVDTRALSDRQGPADFFCSDSSDLSSSVRQTGLRTIVQAVRLDDLDFGGRVDFVKLDVEGSELAVLRGGREFRERTPKAIWMIEADEELLADAGESLGALDAEFGTPRADIHLYTVVGDTWRPISAFTEMSGAHHKNVLVIPHGASDLVQSAGVNEYGIL
jgi:FkbM family methyltransferase